MGSQKGRFRNWIRNFNNSYGYPGYSSEYSLSARIGKHYCPYCDELLQIKRKKQIVDSDSEEFKKFSYYPEGGNIPGIVEFNWDVFYCANCDIEIDISDMGKYEREIKKTGMKVDFDAIRAGKNIDSKIGKTGAIFLIMGLLCALFILIAYVIGSFL